MRSSETETAIQMWQPQMMHNGAWVGFYDDPNEQKFRTEDAAWECARRCFPDTERLSQMVRVVPVE